MVNDVKHVIVTDSPLHTSPESMSQGSNIHLALVDKEGLGAERIVRSFCGSMSVAKTTFNTTYEADQPFKSRF